MYTLTRGACRSVPARRACIAGCPKGYASDLWKYCSQEDERRMLLSFDLLKGRRWTDDQVISCLYAVSNHVEKHYRPSWVEKRDGSRRRLMAPDPLLKSIQRNILRHILDGMEVSPCASAYRKGASVVSHASAHIGRETVLKLDIRDFFGSISFAMVRQRAFPGRYFPMAVGTMLAALCCCRDYLPQGAPTSAAVSNLVMKPFDDYMEKWCRERSVTYNRYCDDMTFSGEFNPEKALRKAKGFLCAMGFELNNEKTRVLTSHDRQIVTGIVVNQKAQTSADYRRRLRQEIYYCGKYGVASHLERSGNRKYLPGGEPDVRGYLLSLRGKIDYVLQANPGDLWFSQARERVKSWQ